MVSERLNISTSELKVEAVIVGLGSSTLRCYCSISGRRDVKPWLAARMKQL